jgi:Zn-finger nucleic acid-binding protein
MKCPKCSADLVKQIHHGIEVDSCTNDHGMWFSVQQLGQLEGETFKGGDHEKGTLIFSSTPSEFKCPKCSAPLRQFDYRLYDLTLEYCENKDGFWLDAGEDERVLQLMAQRKKDMTNKREVDAESRDEEQHEMEPELEWKSELLRLRSKELIDKLMDRFRH